MPLVDWAAARIAARRRNCDVLIFHQRPAGGYYPESEVVDANGRVLRFRRHYFDSPAFADRWSGQAAYLAVSTAHAQSVLNHLLIRGWGLDSVGALTLRFAVRWSADPCLMDGDDPSPLADSGFGLAPPTYSSELKGQPRAGSSAALGVDLERLQGPPYEYRTSSDGAGDIAFTDGDRAYRVVKRCLDASIAFCGLVLLSPLLLLVAAAVKLTSAGPVLFGHVRQGLGGREFRCLKFRSMKVGAERMQSELRALNEVDGPQFKIKNDPRLTPVGGFLRKTNIDELPQLWNVLVGDMSLVGPRPSPDAENQLCPAWRRARLSVLPGITGLWQVLRERQNTASDFQEWIYYDMEYAKHRSLWLDLLILLYTPVAVLAPRRTRPLRAVLERNGICALTNGGAKQTIEPHLAAPARRAMEPFRAD
jgi:lipopolysaccharide/colanic/teichoic acid biosynthesis glycosyltransferase